MHRQPIRGRRQPSSGYRASGVEHLGSGRRGWTGPGQRWAPLLLLAFCGCNEIAGYNHTRSGDASLGDASLDDASLIVADDGASGDRSLSPDRSIRWREVVSLTPATSKRCPGDWRYVNEVEGCALDLGPPCRTKGYSGSATFAVNGSYRWIRGTLTGVQWASTDAFSRNAAMARAIKSVDDPYVDGVSIPVGGSPRRHVFTYAVGLSQITSGAGSGSCPCVGGAVPPSFIGQDWICASGNRKTWDFKNIVHLWYRQAPLWQEGVCPAGKSATFVKALGQMTTDPIEVRILFNQCDENIAITSLILEVK